MLGVQAPVQCAEKYLGGVVNDQRAARAAATHDELVCGFIKHQRGCHRRAWAFAGLHTVGHRFAVGIRRCKAEVGQLVVQQKAARFTRAAVCQLARAKGVFNRRRHGNRVAKTVNDADVRGAVFGLVWHGRIAGFDSAGHTGLGGFHALATGLLGDQFGSSCQVAGLQQAHPVAAGCCHKVRVTQILRTVCKCEPRRFRVQVQKVSGWGLTSGSRYTAHTNNRRQHGRVGVGQNPQNLPNSNRT